MEAILYAVVGWLAVAAIGLVLGHGLAKVRRPFQCACGDRFETFAELVEHRALTGEAEPGDR